MVMGLCVCVHVCSVMSHSLRPHGILQARILEWVAISFSRGSSQPGDQTHVSCVTGSGRLILTTVSPGRPCGTSGQLIDSMTVFVTDESNQLSTSPNLKASLLNSLMVYGTSEH